MGYPSFKKMQVEEITKKLKSNETFDARTLGDFAVRLSGEYSFYSSQLEQILMRKPDEWMRLRQREGVKSDTMADRLWDQTDDGKEEVGYKLRLKAIEKMLSAIKTRAMNAGQDYKNQSAN